MRILVVFAHPLETSFVSALHARVVEILRSRRAYRRRSRPLCGEVRPGHVAGGASPLRRYERKYARSRSLRCSACGPPKRLILVFPVWFDGLPAIMQGYFQRVFLPGVSLRIDEAGLFHPNLRHHQAHGRGLRLWRRAAWTSPRKMIRRIASCADNIGALIDPKGRFQYLALYNMDFNAPSRRAAFMKRVTRAFESWWHAGERLELRSYIWPQQTARTSTTDNESRSKGCRLSSRV